ncbi:MAG: adenosine kinase [Pseudomonadota bacterium]|nr:adenosine kinase [Pseudomonadales bacterium]MDY6919591.1 adenosine kinase [Pseudomonadota bacterium]
MNKYNVYAIGNALVDMEFAVEDEFLNQKNIDKGVMTLVDTDQQQALYEALAGHRGKMASGGSAANTIIAVSHFGGKAFYSCKVANDPAGDFYVQDLVAAGVDTNLHQEREPGISGKCIVMITPDAERTMHSHLGISETVSEAELHPDAIQASDYVYLEGYLVTSPSGRAAAIRARDIAREAGVKTALTFSDPNMVRFFREGLGEMLGTGVDLLFCNREEALTWADTDDLDQACAALKQVANNFAITLGKDGALLFDGQQTHQVPATPVKAVDTNGAGDMFAGALLYGLTHGYSLPEAGRLATRAAAQLVTQFGPRLAAEDHKPLLA